MRQGLHNARPAGTYWSASDRYSLYADGVTRSIPESFFRQYAPEYTRRLDEDFPWGWKGLLYGEFMNGNIVYGSPPVQTTSRGAVQTVSYLPHFVSWVVLAGIFVEILSAQRGPIAHVFTLVGLEPVSWLTYKPTFRGVLVVTGICLAGRGVGLNRLRSPPSIPACTRRLRSTGPIVFSRRSASPCLRSCRS